MQYLGFEFFVAVRHIFSLLVSELPYLFHSSMEGFKELTRQDAENALAHELELLTADIPDHMETEKKRFARQMQSFQHLFKRFIETTKDIDWDKIKLLPDEDVGDCFPIGFAYPFTLIMCLIHRILSR